MVQNRSYLTLAHLKISIKYLDSWRIINKFFDQFVQIHFKDEDYGPATKLPPIIRQFHRTSKNQSERIIVCDGDHFYHPHTIATLDDYSTVYPTSIVGLRGWKIRDDLTWAVSSSIELSYHVIESFLLAQVYPVGIVTANNDYLLRSSFFTSDFYVDFSQSPADVCRMDDIWLNVYASKRNISRLIVPSTCRNINVTQTHELENYLIQHHFSRSSANDHTLR